MPNERPAEQPGGPDVARVMQAVWAFVQSGPNFDGRQRDVEAAITAAIDRAVAAERERCKQAVYDATDWAHESRDFVLKESIVEWIDKWPNAAN